MQLKDKKMHSTGLPICVVTTGIALHDVLQEASVSMVALAQRLAIAGHDVTLLWMPADLRKVEEVAKSIEYFAETYSIKLELFHHPDEIIHQWNNPEYRSFGIYSYLKRNSFGTVYFPLEGGLPYYTLLGKETGVYQPRPRLVVVAHSPMEWTAETDRFFLRDVEQVKFAFMEKYCARQTDRLVCVSSGLRRWFKEKNWELAEDCEVVPALTPFEWLQVRDPVEDLAHPFPRELVLIASPRFRDGISLFCDMLDELAKLDVGDLRLSMIGEFGKILGEHTGGMLIRRGRRWRFPVRMIPNLTLLEGIHYAKQHGSIAIIPNFESATGYCVSECFRLGISFVATSVGGNVDQIAPASARKCLVEAKAASLAAAVAAAIEKPPVAFPRWHEEAKAHLWTEMQRNGARPRAKKEKPKRKGNKPPLVSVIVTHHDRPQYLMQAIASIKDQDYPNFEVILVDDGSKLPESHVALDRLKGDFGKRGWKIIRGKNRYVGAARNTGVRASRGKMIVFVDDDNALFPEAVSTFVSALEHSQSDVCMALSKSVYQANIPGSGRSSYVSYIPLGGCLDVSILGNTFGDTISIYRRSVFDKVGFQLEKFGYMVEDWEFFVRIALAGLKLRLIPEVLFWYRVSTEGRYRSSHYYHNLIPIIDAFAKHDFKGLDYLYNLFMGQNLGNYHLESFRTNLQYSPSDEKYLELTNLEPNSREAITLLAKIAAGESREDTAISLLALAKGGDFRGETSELLNASPLSLNAIRAAGTSLTSDRRLSERELLTMETSTSVSANICPLSYVEKPDRFFLESVGRSLSVSILAAACPALTTSVVSQVSLQQAETEPAEFLILLCPMHEDPVLAAKSAVKERKDGSSGWARVSIPFKPTVLEAHLAIPSSLPMNLVLAVRSPLEKGNTVLGCFSGTIVRTLIEDRVASRPRLGPPPYKYRAREWTDLERKNAQLVTDYRSELPLLLFPKEPEGGIFLRPSDKGPVVAIIERGFPAFARQMLGKVEIAHEEASPFEFAMALTLPNSLPHWRWAGPKNPVAFSGWVKVEDKFKLHDINLKLRETIPAPLSVSIAVRLPRGSSPSPANAFWRSLVFFWDE